MFLFPEPTQLSQAMSLATAPAFVLTGLANLLNVLLGRTARVVERVRSLNAISDNDGSRAHLKSDIPRLHRRIDLLSSATRLAIASGVCTASLIIVGFLFAFAGLPYIWGFSILFLSALALLGASLLRFGQEVRMGLSEVDYYRL